MLSNEQTVKLILMVQKYHRAMERTSRADRTTIRSWVTRYRIAMEQELLKRHKH